MATYKHYDDHSSYVKAQATKEINYKVKDFYTKLTEQLSIEEMKTFTWDPLFDEQILASFFDKCINEYVVVVYSQTDKFLGYCVYPEDRLKQVIYKQSTAYFNYIWSRKPSDAQMEYAKSMQADLNTNLELPTDNYLAFITTFNILLRLHQTYKEQQRVLLEKEYEEKKRMEPATERQLIAIENSYNYFAKGKRQLDTDMLPHLSKYDAHVILNLFQSGKYLERVERVDNYLAQLREKCS